MKIRELQDVLSQLPIKGETAFVNTRGKFREKIKRQQLKYLRDYVADLKHVLEDGEEVLLGDLALEETVGMLLREEI